MDAWDELVKAAVIGTERQPSRTAAPPGAAGELLQRINRSDRELAFLSEAAVLAVCRRAGFVPAQATDGLLQPAPVDDLPACGPAASDRLGRMLSGEHTLVLPEWLAALASAKKRVPYRHLPELLEAGRATADLRPLIEPVIGARGRWLMAQNPDWQWLARDSDPESIWQTGNRDARLSLLRRLRQREPTRARALLETTWTNEPPEERIVFLSALQAGLGADDEPFLEAALDDRRKEVRRAAAALLYQLPTSRLAARMIERLRPVMSVTASRRGASIDIKSAPVHDKFLERDGIEAGAPKGLGEKGYVLRQMLASVPPRHWTAEGSDPVSLVRAALKHDWSAALLMGWADAAVNHRDMDWARALTAEWIVALPIDEAVRQQQVAEKLIRLLPPCVREEALAPMLKKLSVPMHEGPLIVLLRAADHRWSEAFTRVFADALRRQVTKFSNGYDYNLRTIIPDLGRHMDPGSAALLADGWPEDSGAWAQWKSTIDQLLSLLQFRHDMLKEIAS